ncbi:MAG: Hsp20 family protein [Verrucomicrobiota bacterium]
MKTSNRNRSSAAVLALGAILITAWTPCAIAAETAEKNDQGFIEKMDQWQDKMSEKFRDTWKSLRSDAKQESVATASVDLREDKDNYTLRLNLPNRDLTKVGITLVGDTLRIIAPASDNAGRYEQTVSLAGADARVEPKIERKPEDDMIVITVQKGPMMAEKKPSLTLPDPELLPFTDWDHDIFARMDKMRREMDGVFENAFSEFRTAPEYNGFFDEPRFGSSLDLKEQEDRYTIRAYLPDRSMQNVNVTVEDRTLKIEATEQTTTRKQGDIGNLHSTSKAAFSQLVTLPGPVQSDHMKVDKHEGMLVITLPKAK